MGAVLVYVIKCDFEETGFSNAFDDSGLGLLEGREGPPWNSLLASWCAAHGTDCECMYNILFRGKQQSSSVMLIRDVSEQSI